MHARQHAGVCLSGCEKVCVCVAVCMWAPSVVPRFAAFAGLFPALSLFLTTVLTPVACYPAFGAAKFRKVFSLFPTKSTFNMKSLPAMNAQCFPPRSHGRWFWRDRDWARVCTVCTVHMRAMFAEFTGAFLNPGCVITCASARVCVCL